MLERKECEIKLTGNNDWQRLSLAYSAPDEATSLQLAAGLWNANGTAWFDCFQFESGVSPNAYNVLENRAFAIAIGIIYADGTNEPCYIQFNPDVDQWQTMSFTAAPKKENWNKVIDHINIYVVYYNQENTAFYDDVMVTLDETGTAYTYDYLSANRPNRTDLVVGKVSRTYDNLQREIKHQVYSSDNGTTYLETTTAFIGVDGNQTTQLPRIYTTLRTDGVNDPTRPGGYTGFTYAYDANGNITAINESNGTTSRTRTYTYDALNRLKTDSDPVTGKTTTYTYDARGKLISTTGSKANTIGKLNPFRYRGYVYDEETELYYVSSRYYDAEVGRFINADTTDVLTATPTALTDKNLFAYCDNNPITRADNGGEFWNIVIGAVVGGIVNAVTTAIDTYKSTGSIDWGKVGISAAVGAVSGAVADTGYSTVGNDILSAGKDKLMTGYARKFTGQSSSKLIKQGRNLSALGKNTLILGEVYPL